MNTTSKNAGDLSNQKRSEFILKYGIKMFVTRYSLARNYCSEIVVVSFPVVYIDKIYRLVVLSLILVLVALLWHCLVAVFCRLVFHFYFTRNNDTCNM